MERVTETKGNCEGSVGHSEHPGVACIAFHHDGCVGLLQIFPRLHHWTNVWEIRQLLVSSCSAAGTRNVRRNCSVVERLLQLPLGLHPFDVALHSARH